MIDRADHPTPGHFYISTQARVCTASVAVYTPKSTFFYCMLISVCTNGQKCIWVQLRALSSADTWADASSAETVGGTKQLVLLLSLFFLYNRWRWGFLLVQHQPVSSFQFSDMVSRYKTNYLLRHELCCHGCPLCLPLYPAAGFKSQKWSFRLLWHSELSFLIAESLEVAKLLIMVPLWRICYLSNIKMTWKVHVFIAEGLIFERTLCSHLFANATNLNSCTIILLTPLFLGCMRRCRFPQVILHGWRQRKL